VSSCLLARISYVNSGVLFALIHVGIRNQSYTLEHRVYLVVSREL